MKKGRHSKSFSMSNWLRHAKSIQSTGSAASPSCDELNAEVLRPLAMLHQRHAVVGGLGGRGGVGVGVGVGGGGGGTGGGGGGTGESGQSALPEHECDQSVLHSPPEPPDG